MQTIHESIVTVKRLRFRLWMLHGHMEHRGMHNEITIYVDDVRIDLDCNGKTSSFSSVDVSRAHGAEGYAQGNYDLR